ncbi:MAG TPA: diguanylate cyclase [Gaiellaceae bacterium]|nr:diguanylate cyclase [Gaiellaceae bacterium]
MSSHRVWAPLTWAIAVGGVAALGLVLLTTSSGERLNSFFDVEVYLALIVLSVAIVARRAYTVEKDRTAWIVITAALGSSAFAELYDAVVAPTQYPSPADFGWLAFYPLLYAGIVLLILPRASSIAGTLWLDGVTASLAAAALGAAVLVELVLRSAEGSASAVATNLAYPLGDVLLLSAVFGIFSLANWRPGRRWLVLGLGVLATTIADAVYLFQSAAGTYRQGTWLDLLWPASMLLIAWAAWIDDGDERGLAVEGRPLLAVPATCALVSIGILVYDHFGGVNVLAVLLATATLLAVLLRLVATFRENRRLYVQTHQEATTDALTGLGNRRKLLLDLDDVLVRREGVTLLMLFDLDGFKGYNDSFGHPAGDALLARLGGKLGGVPGESGAAYRLGGDEFCLVASVPSNEVGPLIDRASDALTERGEGFQVASSFGAVLLPEEATEASDAMRLADERLYSQKYSRRGESDRTMNAFLQALGEREPDLQAHLEGVATLAVEIGERLGLRRDELEDLSRAAQLHDLGKLAVPDEILEKPGPLDEREWAFIRQHTVVGERILRASLAFRSIAGIVRSSHESWDGSGYPDGLAGEEIPLASRIVCACDAFAAMTSDRPYRAALPLDAALEELRKGAGAQFDPTVVRVIEAHVLDKLETGRAA